jgi:hypothetical protein
MESMPEEAARKPNAPLWIKLFVLFHVVAITLWALPRRDFDKSPPKATDYILYWNSKYALPSPPLQAYLFTTGFWQYWDMFSPNPSQTDIWCDAEVVYKNGEKKIYHYPRVSSMSLTQKYVSERYRKFYERVNQEKYSYLWAPFAQRIAYLNDDPSNPPVAVRLRRHWLTVSPPGIPQAKDYSSYTYFTWVVNQAKLESDRKGLW